MTEDELNAIYRKETRRVANAFLVRALEEVPDNTRVGSSIVLGALFMCVGVMLEVATKDSGEREKLLEHYVSELRGSLRKVATIEKLKNDVGVT